MMSRLALGWLAAALLLGAGLAPFAKAGERKLTAAEIEAVLAGNTVDGNWKGTPFRQYFGKDGATVYVAKGAEASPGKWKSDTEKDQYCSWWQGSGWDCYDLYSDGPDSIIWVVPADGYRSPSKLLPGRKLY